MEEKSDNPASNSPPSLCPRAQHNEPGQRHWYKITGLPGWQRDRIGVPARGHKLQYSAEIDGPNPGSKGLQT
jgi:hypothetical protein